MRNPDPRLFQLEQEATNLRRELHSASIGVHRDLEAMIGALRLTAEYLRDTTALLKVLIESLTPAPEDPWKKDIGELLLKRMKQQDLHVAMNLMNEMMAPTAQLSKRKNKTQPAGKKTKGKKGARNARRANILDESGSQRRTKADHRKIKAV